jgi:hypothetical protein
VFYFMFFLPFHSCNIGNPQASGCEQKPLTFPRQVMSCVVNPALIDFEPSPFPGDVRARAREILSGLSGNSIGACV